MRKFEIDWASSMICIKIHNKWRQSWNAKRHVLDYSPLNKTGFKQGFIPTGIDTELYPFLQKQKEGVCVCVGDGGGGAVWVLSVSLPMSTTKIKLKKKPERLQK